MKISAISENLIDGDPKNSLHDSLNKSRRKILNEEEDKEKKKTLIFVRLMVKNIVTLSTAGRCYDKLLLWISVLSSISVIYQTYITDRKEIENIFNTCELVLACIFLFDWILQFYIADHKLIFLTRFY